MQYHLDTIPVWEALELNTPCPLCALYAKTDKAETERSLGGSVMEPSERIKINETGLCQHHHQRLFGLQNRLGHALLTDSHTKEQLKKLDKLEKQADGISGRGLFGKGSGSNELVDALKAMANGCVICLSTESHMKRYLYTFVHLWKSDDAFKQKWEASDGLCLPHAAQLIDMASRELSGDKLRQFCKAMLAELKKHLSQDEKDLEWFTLKFDYRNQDKPWGNSRNALERTVNRLRGRCLGDKD